MSLSQAARTARDGTWKALLQAPKMRRSHILYRLLKKATDEGRTRGPRARVAETGQNGPPVHIPRSRPGRRICRSSFLLSLLDHLQHHFPSRGHVCSSPLNSHMILLPNRFWKPGRLSSSMADDRHRGINQCTYIRPSRIFSMYLAAWLLIVPFYRLGFLKIAVEHDSLATRPPSFRTGICSASSFVRTYPYK